MPPRARTATEWLALYAARDMGYETPCHVWLGSTHWGGYGRLRLGGQGAPELLAHRFAFEATIGPIPQGHDLHHRCGVRACINAAHLQPITPRDHERLHKTMQTHCKRGHRFDEVNTYIDPRGCRNCRTCRAARARDERRRKSAVGS